MSAHGMCRVGTAHRSTRWLPLIMGLAATAQLGAQPPQLTIERITSLPSLAGTAPVSPIWSPDSRQLALLWNDEGWPFRDVWIVEATGTSPRRLTDMRREIASFTAMGGSSGAAETGGRSGADERAARGQIDPRLVREAAERARIGVTEVVWTPDGQSVVFNVQGQIFQVGADGSNLTRLTETPGARRAIAVSPDGQMLSFLQGGDLWFVNLATREARQVTRSGARGAGTIAAARGSVMQAEFGSYQWAPDGRHIALLFNDRRTARTVLIPNFIGEETTAVPMPRGFPGDKDDEVESLVMLTVASGETRSIKIEGAHRSITNYDWSPDGRQLMVDQSSFDSVHRWVHLVMAGDGAVRQIWHDERATRTAPLWRSTWQSDGEGILFVTNIDGWYHLYALPTDGGQAKLLTPGNYSVLSDAPPALISVAPGTKEVFFPSSQKSPYERQIYRVAQAGGEVEQVTSLGGTHFPCVSPDGSTLAVLHSNDVMPTELYLVDVKGRSSERRITHSPLKEFSNYPWIQPRYVTFKSRVDGVTLHGRLVEPPNLDRTKKYPVILGPVYRDTVRNMWRDRYALLQQYLALDGQYIGFHVDVRGSTVYGREFEERILKDYGNIDIEDLHSGVEYLKTLPYVDPDRIGLWGSSYGGLLTLTSVFKKPGVYKAAVAGAAATNAWHATSTHTRLGRDPWQDAENYRNGSPISFGEKLQDRLMIIHGVQDDVVLFKDSVMLAEKLMLLGKNFDLVLVPTSGHGWSQRDYYARYTFTKLVEHFDRYLGRGPRASGR